MGDEVWVLAGYKVALARRPMGGGKYRLICDVHVHGIMYGEALPEDAGNGSVQEIVWCRQRSFITSILLRGNPRRTANNCRSCSVLFTCMNCFTTHSSLASYPEAHNNPLIFL